MLDLMEKNEIRTSNGSRAALRDNNGDEVLETRDNLGRLIFEFHPATGKAIVCVPAALEIRAAGEIRFRGRAIELESERDVRIRTPETELHAGIDSLSVKTPSLRVASEDLTIQGGRVQAETRDVRFRADRLEQVVGRAVLVARDVFHRVEGLFHTRARRARTQVRQDFTVQARTGNLVAREDFRIQGETIHLG